MANYKYISKKGYEGKYTILREYCKNKKEPEAFLRRYGLKI